MSHKQQLWDERYCRGILLMILNSERIYQSIYLSRRLRGEEEFKAGRFPVENSLKACKGAGDGSLLAY